MCDTHQSYLTYLLRWPIKKLNTLCVQMFATKSAFSVGRNGSGGGVDHQHVA